MSNPSVDLQAVSIDPTKTEIFVGGQCTIKVNMKNNGPDVLPKGEAKVHVTVNGAFLTKPNTFSSAGKKWKLEAIQLLNGNYEVFAVNNLDMQVNEPGFPGFQFKVKGKGKQEGVAAITLSSSLSGTATSSDVDGQNQSVSTEVKVKPKK